MMIMTIQLFYNKKILQVFAYTESSLMVLVSSSSYKFKWNCKYIFFSHLTNVVHWEFLEGREERSEKDHNLKIKSDEFMTIVWWSGGDFMTKWWSFYDDFLIR